MPPGGVRLDPASYAGHSLRCGFLTSATESGIEFGIAAILHEAEWHQQGESGGRLATP